MIEGVVQFTGPIGPTASGDTFPTHIDIYGKGGLRNVYDITERNNIPFLRRDLGMVVGIQSDNLYWKLMNNPTGDTTTNGDWGPFNDVYVTSGSYDPITGIVTFTNNSGSTFTVTGFMTGMTDTYTTGAAKFVITTGFTGSVLTNVVHSLNTEDVLVQIWDSTKQLVGGTVLVNNVNSVDITMSVTDTYKIVIIG